MTPKFFDFSVFSSEEESWQELWDFQEGLAANVMRLMQSSIFLPEYWQYQLVAAYILCPSALAKRVPILFCHGPEGSGKSQLGQFASIIHNGKLWNKSIATSSDTFASLRNKLSMSKYYDEDCRFEKNAILVWDDIDPTLLKTNDQIYRMLKSGYDKATDQISIAGKDGKNIRFRVFCPKICSSIHAIYADQQFAELNRRIIVVKFKKWEQFSSEERARFPADALEERIDYPNFNWDGIERNLHDFWENSESCILYNGYRTSLARRNSRYRKFVEMTAAQWTISIDLIATALTVGLFATAYEAICYFNNYWQWHENHRKTNTPMMVKLLKDWIDEETKTERRMRAALLAAGEDAEEFELRLCPRRVRAAVVNWQNNGQLDQPPTMANIISAMGTLGWKLTTEGWVIDKG